MRVASVVGYQDSGKTTLIERLVPVLAADGPVATVKSIHHDVAVDTQGKDTHRHRTAGAETVVGVTPSRTFQITERGKDDGVSIESVLADLAEEGYAYVLVEGFKESDLPAILVGEIEAAAVGGTVLARVSTPDAADLDALCETVRDLPEWTA